MRKKSSAHALFGDLLLTRCSLFKATASVTASAFTADSVFQVQPSKQMLILRDAQILAHSRPPIQTPQAAPIRKLRLWPLACVLAFITIWAASSVQAATRNCTKQEAKAGDRALALTGTQKNKAIATALAAGLPTEPESETATLLVQRDYVTEYSGSLRVPLWTAHRIVPKALGKSGRINCFRADPRLTTKHIESTPADYDEPIFDQGHMTPNGDMTSSLNAVVNSFLMSNMTPQHCHFNRGIWEMFEEIVRFWAKNYGKLYVITGSVFDKDGDGKRDPDSDIDHMASNNGDARVAVPTHVYKVLSYKAGNNLVTLAILLPNTDQKVNKAEAVNYLTTHIVPLKSIETLTGEKLFSSFTGTIQETDATTFWDTDKAPFSPLDATCKAS